VAVLQAGTVYFAIVFAFGFLFGTLRVLFVAPSVGETRAVLIELPLMLAVSWYAARWICARFAIAGLGSAVATGATAFALLMSAEFALGTFGFGQTLVQQLAAFATPAGALGVVGQIAFAIMPVFRRSG
jgi:hypothetical protein